MTKPGPVVLIGLDAAEISVVERLLAAGRLPNLRALRESGAWGRVRNQPPGFLSLVWPSFFSGTGLGQHGWYYSKLWRPEHMRLEYGDPTWLGQAPFWDDLAGTGVRLALLDIPYAMATPVRLDGIYLNGWQCHDDFGQRSSPSGLWGELVARFGKSPLRPELFGPQTGSGLLRLHAQLLASIEQTAAISAHLLARERFDLFAVVIGGVHRGGHYLHDLSQIDGAALAADERRTLAGAEDDLYLAADAAVGRILAQAPAEARVLVFALHGMGRNTGWNEIFPQLIHQIQRGGAATPASTGLLYRIKRALPWQLVREVTTRLPTAVNHRLISIWSRRMYDWRETRFFPLPVDVNGFVRLNLRGREAEGIVAPADYEAVLQELEAALASFRTLEGDEPVVDAVDRIDDLVGTDAPRRKYLPDLCARWNDAIAAQDGIGVHSPRSGELRWARGRRLGSGRSGNHRAAGWLIAHGPGIAAGTEVAEQAPVDLTATIFAWLGQPIPARLEGRRDPALAAEPTATGSAAGAAAAAPHGTPSPARSTDA